MFKITTLNKIDSKGTSKFDNSKYQVTEELNNTDGVLVRSFKMHDLEFPESLKAIGRAGAGVNNIPVDRCTSEGVVVFNTPGANANAVKELVIAGLLISSRNIIGGINWTQSLGREDGNIPKKVEQEKSNFGGVEIAGKTLGVIGLGAIGIMVANAALGLGMNVIGYDPYLSVQNAWNINNTITKSNSLEDILSKSDFISLNIPLLDSTKEFIDSEKLLMMKDGVRILNFARGGLVNNEDLIAALKRGKVAHYVTDFPDEDLIEVPGVIPIPHLGASTEESETNCAIMAVDQIKDFLENGNIRNSVNFPEASMPRNGGNRIIIANRNVPNMVAQISSTLASEEVNIANMINKNRSDIAYNIIDVDRSNLDLAVADKILEIEGVLMCRIIE